MKKKVKLLWIERLMEVRGIDPRKCGEGIQLFEKCIWWRTQSWLNVKHSLPKNIYLLMIKFTEWLQLSAISVLSGAFLDLKIWLLLICKADESFSYILNLWSKMESSFLELNFNSSVLCWNYYNQFWICLCSFLKNYIWILSLCSLLSRTSINIWNVLWECYIFCNYIWIVYIFCCLKYKAMSGTYVQASKASGVK